jgi:hypothetical protein
MRAILLEKFGDLDSLVYKDIPEPELKAGARCHRGVRHQRCRDAAAVRAAGVSYCLFTDPLLSRVGLNEIEA